MVLGICPFAQWRPTLNVGYPEGAHDQNRPLVFVDHVMAGYKSTMDDPVWLRNSGVSVHFSVGIDGSISQYVNIFDAAYGNGVVGMSPRGDRRGIDLYNRANSRLASIEQEAQSNWHIVDTSQGSKWTLSIGGANAWNTRSISTEHEGFTGTPWTQAMIDADVKLKRWCNEELVAHNYSPIPFTTEGIIGHVDIDHIDRMNCPGTGRPLELIIAELAGDDDMYITKQDGNLAVWWHNRVLQPTPALEYYEMLALPDFSVPAGTKRVRFQVRVTGGYLRFFNGVTQTEAGECGWPGGNTPRSEVIEADVDPATGKIRFRAEELTTVAEVFLLGYWIS